eukprot:gene14961-biopygen20154
MARGGGQVPAATWRRRRRRGRAFLGDGSPGLPHTGRVGKLDSPTQAGSVSWTPPHRPGRGKLQKCGTTGAVGERKRPGKRRRRRRCGTKETMHRNAAPQAPLEK